MADGELVVCCVLIFFGLSCSRPLCSTSIVCYVELYVFDFELTTSPPSAMICRMVSCSMVWCFELLRYIVSCPYLFLVVSTTSPKGTNIYFALSSFLIFCPALNCFMALGSFLCLCHWVRSCFVLFCSMVFCLLRVVTYSYRIVIPAVSTSAVPTSALLAQRRE